MRSSLELDPGFARAWSALGAVYGVSSVNGFVDDPQAANKLAKEYTLRALSLDPTERDASRTSVSSARWMAMWRAPRGIWKMPSPPSRATPTSSRAWCVAPTIIGEPERMAELARRAIRLNPSGPSWYYFGLGIAEFVGGHYRETVEAMEKTPLDGAGSLAVPRHGLCRARRRSADCQAVQRIRTEFPSFTVEGYIRDCPVIYPPALALFRDAAQKASLMPVSQPTQ